MNLTKFSVVIFNSQEQFALGMNAFYMLFDRVRADIKLWSNSLIAVVSSI